LGCILATVLSARPAVAHSPGLSTGDWVIYPDGRVEASLVFASTEALNVRGGSGVVLDENHDGAVTDEELADARADLEHFVVEGVGVEGDGAPCPGRLTGAELTSADGLELDAVFTCGKPPRRLAVTLYFLSDLGPGHREVARVAAGSLTEQKLLSPTDRQIALTLPAPQASRSRLVWLWGPAAILAAALAALVVRRLRG
jgi:hypothetical protein